MAETRPQMHLDSQGHRYFGGAYDVIKTSDLITASVPTVPKKVPSTLNVLNFNGTSSYVSVPNVTLGTNFTVEFFARANTVQSDSYMISRRMVSDVTKGWSITVGSGANIILRQGGTTVATVPTANNPILYSWNHYCVTFTPSLCTVYINGNALATTSSTVTNDDTQTIVFGAASYNTAQKNFAGEIANVRMYNRVLSVSEIIGNMTSNVTRTGIVGEWLLNQGTGTAAINTAGGSTGTITNGTWFVDRELPSIVFTVSPASGITNVPASTLGSNYSIECWVKVTATTVATQVAFVSRKTPLATGWSLGLSASNTTSPKFALMEGTTVVIQANTSPSYFQWNHVVATVNPTTSSLYVNGVLVATGATATTNDDTQNFGIGSYFDGTANNINGILSNVRIYSKPLSADEVLNNYNFNITTQSLTNQFIMDDGRGSTVFNSITYSNNTAQNITWISTATHLPNTTYDISPAVLHRVSVSIAGAAGETLTIYDGKTTVAVIALSSVKSYLFDAHLPNGFFYSTSSSLTAVVELSYTTYTNGG